MWQWRLLFRIVEWSVERLTYIYVLRVPLLCSLLLLFLSFRTSSSLLGNLFDVPTAWPMFLLSFTAFITAWTIMITSRIILIYGPERFGLFTGRIATNIKWRHILMASFIVLPLVIVTLRYPDPVWSEANLGALFFPKFLATVLGLAASLCVLAIAEVMQKWFTDPIHASQHSPDTPAHTNEIADSAPDVFFPSDSRLIQRIIHFVIGRTPPFPITARLLSLAQIIPENLGIGYFTYKKGTRSRSWHGESFFGAGLLECVGGQERRSH